MLLYCVRHGQSEFNAEGRIQGQLDTQLSELGRRQADAVAGALAACKVQAIFASPLSRARDTALSVAMATGLDVVFDDRLKEINAGVFQGKLWSEIEVVFPEETRLWRSHDPDYAMPAGESRRDLMRRGKAALESLQDCGYERVAVIAHGGVVTAAFKALLDVPADRSPFDLCNGSISRCGWVKGEFKLISLNETSHLHHLDGGATLGMQL